MTDHDHGTWRRYRYDGCSCDRCRTAWSTYVELCDLRRRRGQQRLVDATPAVHHIRDLMDTYGIASWKLWPAAGVSKSMGHRLLQEQAHRMDRDRLAQVLELTIDDLPDDVCVGVHVLDRAIEDVRGRHGWTIAEIERRAGLADRFVNDARRAGRSRVSLAAIRAVRDLLTLCVDCHDPALPGGFARCLPCFQAQTLPQTRREVADHARREHNRNKARRNRAAHRKLVAA